MVFQLDKTLICLPLLNILAKCLFAVFSFEALSPSWNAKHLQDKEWKQEYKGVKFVLTTNPPHISCISLVEMQKWEKQNKSQQGVFLWSRITQTPCSNIIPQLNKVGVKNTIILQ